MSVELGVKLVSLSLVLIKGRTHLYSHLIELLSGWKNFYVLFDLSKINLIGFCVYFDF